MAKNILFYALILAGMAALIHLGYGLGHKAALLQMKAALGDKLENCKVMDVTASNELTNFRLACVAPAPEIRHNDT